jgi:hypothetical protein
MIYKTVGRWTSKQGKEKGREVVDLSIIQTRIYYKVYFHREIVPVVYVDDIVGLPLSLVLIVKFTNDIETKRSLWENFQGGTVFLG